MFNRCTCDRCESISGSQELGLGDQVNKFAVSVFVTLLFFVSKPALAQMDVAFGASTLNSPSSTTPTFIFGPQPLNGGTYLSISGNQLFFKEQFGVGGKYHGRRARRFMRGINRTARYFGISTGFGCRRWASAPRESFRQESERRVFVSTTIFTRATSPRARTTRPARISWDTSAPDCGSILRETPLSVLRFTFMP